jgi:hypothetical protein
MRKEQQVDDLMSGVEQVAGLGQKGDEELMVEHREVLDTCERSDMAVVEQ